MLLHWLQKTDGKPIALMGGGTTRVGDPSGKDASRQLLPLETIAANKEGIKRVFARFLKFGEEKHDAIMPDNAEWLATLNYIDFLRDVGRHFSVNRMLAMDSVNSGSNATRNCRSSNSITCAFRPMILSSFSSAMAAFCRWAARTNGATSSPGSISAAGWARASYTADFAALDDGVGRQNGQDRARGGMARRRPVLRFEYWQYWRNCEDRDTGRFLKLFTELPLDEISRLEVAGRH